MGTSQADKIRENRLRAAAKRQGYRLIKSRRRDPRALSFDRYMLAAPGGGGIGVHKDTGEPAWSLDEVGAYLGDHGPGDGGNHDGG
jgi:hypothetical protein